MTSVYIISGIIVGNQMKDYCAGAPAPEIDLEHVQSVINEVYAPLNEDDGTEPMEMESSIRYINDHYIGMHISEGKLKEGLNRLASLKREFMPHLMAKTPHDLMRCVEVRNIFDGSILHLKACLNRKESRGNFIRNDYPERDPNNDNYISVCFKENGEDKIEMMRAPELKPEYLEEGK